MKPISSRKTLLLIVTCLVPAALLLAVACGKKGCKGSSSTDGPGSSDPGTKKAVPTRDGKRPGEIDEEEDGCKSSITPGERRRLTAALEALKNNVFLNDPEGFEKSFWDVQSLKSIVWSMKGKEGWKEMLASVNGDELEYEKQYRKSLKDLFEDLREPGGRCGLSPDAVKAIRSSGKPPDLLLADTFAYSRERNRIVVLCGFRDASKIRGLLRLRAMPHHNRLKWIFRGDERIESMESISALEVERVGQALASIAKAQETFRNRKRVDRDGDGNGEYAFFSELAGAVELRGSDGEIHDAGLPPGLGEVSVSGMALWGAHLFRVFLPGESGPAHGDRAGSLEIAAVTDRRERGYCGVAWPAARGCGKNLYFVGCSGVILQSRAPSPFLGLDNPPPAGVGFKEKAGEKGLAWDAPLEQAGTSGTGIRWEVVR